MSKPTVQSVSSLASIIYRLEQWQGRFKRYDESGKTESAKDDLMRLLRTMEDARRTGGSDEQ